VGIRGQQKSQVFVSVLTHALRAYTSAARSHTHTKEKRQHLGDLFPPNFFQDYQDFFWQDLFFFY
jgi:hypothetical protein